MRPKAPMPPQRMILIPRGEDDDSWFLVWHCADAAMVRLEPWTHEGAAPQDSVALAAGMKGAKVFTLSQASPGVAFPVQLNPDADPFYEGGSIGETEWIESWSEGEIEDLLKGIVSAVWPTWKDIPVIKATLPLIAANKPMRREW